MGRRPEGAATGQQVTIRLQIDTQAPGAFISQGCPQGGADSIADPSPTAAAQVLSRRGPLPQAPRPAIQRAIDQPPIAILDDLPDDAGHGGGRHWRLVRQLPRAVTPALALRLMHGLEARQALGEALALCGCTTHEIAARG